MIRPVSQTQKHGIGVVSDRLFLHCVKLVAHGPGWPGTTLWTAIGASPGDVVPV